MNYEQHSIVRNLSVRMMDQKKPPVFDIMAPDAFSHM
jgi:hypothetical protein